MEVRTNRTIPNDVDVPERVIWQPPFRPFYYPNGIGDNTPPYLFHIANYCSDVPSALAFLKEVDEERERLYKEQRIYG